MRRKALQNNIRVQRAAPLWRTAFMFVVLLVFILQSFVTQTHIHRGERGGADSGIALIHDDRQAGLFESDGDKSHDSHGKPPADDPDHCPFCQQALLGGLYIPPAAIPLTVSPPLAAAVLVLGASAIPPRARAHTWLGRAPPSL